MFRHFDSGLRQRADRTQSCQVIESHHCGEFFLLLQQFFCVTVSTLETGIGIERIRQLQNERRVDFDAGTLREFLYPTPSWRAVDQHLRPADKRDFAMAELVQMLER